MELDSKQIKEIYSSKVAGRYDSSMSHFFPKFKRFAIEDSFLKLGDRVLVFCCGSGLDFPYIEDKIGPEGEIIAVDFSSTMLEKAAASIKKNHWKNIQLIEEDITIFNHSSLGSFDAGLCTLGISIIPDYKTAYYNLLSYVKTGGEMIIGDMQIATGWRSIFNPLILRLSKKFGGTIEGHQNSREICALMQKDLQNVTKKEFFLHSYFYAIGIKE